MPLRHLSAPALANWLKENSQPPRLIDVREPWEFAICHIQGSQLIPMSSIAQNLIHLPKNQDLVVICHHGIRSAQVGHYLEKHAYTKVNSLAGGVDAWAKQVDPGMAVY